jgi:hypothetical protein
MKKRRFSGFLPGLLTAAAALAVLFWFFGALSSLRSDEGEEGRQQLENALRRAAVSCYAAEGVYPPDLDYLTAHYGIQIDTDRYEAFYEIFADNLMPNLTVLERTP